MRIKLSRLVDFLSLMFFALFFLAACDSKPPSSENEAAVLAKPAKLIVVGRTNSDDFLNYPAVIKSQQLSILSFEVGGVLKELLVVEAQEVKKGEVLARLDQRDLQEKLKSARAQFENAEAEYQRAVRLMEADAIARSELEQRKSKRDVNKSQLATAEKALQDSVLVAPYTGNISKILIQERQAVQAGESAINILGKGELEAVVNLPSSILAKVERQKTPPELLSYIVLDAAPERRIPARFKEISLEADAVLQTYELTFTFDAPERLIVLPGMNAAVWFKDPGKPVAEIDKVKIPLTAIVTDGEQKYVWVVDRESTIVARRNITVADGIGGSLTVLSGLKSGETIVAAGVSSLSEGMKVRPWSK